MRVFSSLALWTALKSVVLRSHLKGSKLGLRHLLEFSIPSFHSHATCASALSLDGGHDAITGLVVVVVWFCLCL